MVIEEVKVEVKEEGGELEAEEASGVEMDLSVVSEGVSEEYVLSSTLRHEEKGEEREAEDEKEDES